MKKILTQAGKWIALTIAKKAIEEIVCGRILTEVEKAKEQTAKDFQDRIDQFRESSKRTSDIIEILQKNEHLYLDTINSLKKELKEKLEQKDLAEEALKTYGRMKKTVSKTKKSD